MYSRVKERIFLLFLCLSLEAFGAIPAQLLENVVKFSPSEYPIALECPSNGSNKTSWSVWPVGGKRMKVIKSGASLLDPDFYDADTIFDPNTETLVIKFVNASTAGVYSCDYGGKLYAQFIVIMEEISCKISSKPVKTGARDKRSQLSCAIRYAANSSYVIPRMIWRIDGFSESPISSTNLSTSANITTATSTLNVTWSQNNTCIQKYTCKVGFGLTDKLPSGFATNDDSPLQECAPNTVVCTTVKPTETTTKTTTETTTKTITKTTTKTTTEKPTKNPRHFSDKETDETLNGKSTEPASKHPDEDWDEKPGEKSGEPYKPRYTAGGLSVGSSKIYILINCVVDIVGALLINARTSI